MTKKYNYWTPETLKQFKHDWQHKTSREIMKIYVHHTYNQLKSVAGYYKIKKKITLQQKQLKNLISFTPESCYWLGFLMGDGNFYKNRIDVCLSNRDRNHLEKYVRFNNLTNIIKTRIINNYEYCRVCVEDSYTVNKIRDIFKSYQAKTYNPYDLTYILSHPNFIPFFIGYIDADGYIGKRHNSIHIKLIAHASWYNNFQLLSKKLQSYNIDTKVYRNKYVELYIIRKQSSLNLYEELCKYNLPILHRKWDKFKLIQ